MEDNNDALTPLLQARQRIDIAMEALRVKMAGLSKKRDALNTAINIIQSPDEDVATIAKDLLTQKSVKTYTVCDKSVLAPAVLDILSDGRARKKSEICKILDERGISHNPSAMYQVLTTNPSITKTGERDQTRYKASY